MLSICNICLRSDRILRTVDEELDSFYDDLCNFNNVSGFQFCFECAYKLRKCYEFKKICCLAVKKLKLWKRQKSKKPIALLYKELPITLEICNGNNFKEYFYKSSDLNTTIQLNCEPHNVPDNQNDSNINTRSKTIETDNSHQLAKDNQVVKDEEITNGTPESIIIDNNHIDVDKSCSQNSNEDVNSLNYQQYKVKDEPDDNADLNENNADVNENNADLNETITENNADLNENNADNNDDADSSDKDYLSDSDASLKELMKKIKKRKMLEPKPKREVKWYKSKFDINELKGLLRRKFEKHGLVKDEKGNVIDPEIVLNNLDKYSDKNLNTIKTVCSAPGPFKSNAIRRLAQVQERFAGYETVFNMMYLNDETQMAAEFEKRREYPEYVDNEHRCHRCIKGFRNAKTLENHNKTQHDESLPYKCILCQSFFKTAKILNRHTLTSHTMVYKCKLCTNFITNCRTYMLSHYDKHKGLLHKCKECGKQFPHKSSFYLHINKAHAMKICEICACAFHNVTGLSKHKLLKHEVHGEEFVQSSDNVKCEECDIIFITNDVYNKHMNITHNLTIDQDSSDVKPKKRRAPVNRSKDYVYTCRLCSWQGSSALSRVHHHSATHPAVDMQTIYGARRHLCHACGKGFNSEQVYRYHMNKHAGLRPYACSTCGKRFFNHNNLNIHKERHLPPKHQCNLCDKKFTTAIGLRSHMRIHIGDRRYKCEICGKGFLYPTALKEHVNGVHYQIRRKRKQGLIEDH